jgi:hypothetical protein
MILGCENTTSGMQHSVHWNTQEMQSVVLDVP